MDEWLYKKIVYIKEFKVSTLSEDACSHIVKILVTNRNSHHIKKSDGKYYFNIYAISTESIEQIYKLLYDIDHEIIES